MEKDYWVMHTVFGLKQLGLTFELKGGTSLSKGFGVMHRFSEDIDIGIESFNGLRVDTNPNHEKELCNHRFMPKKKTKQRQAKKKAIGHKQKTRQVQRERTRMDYGGMEQLFNGVQARSKG